MSTFTAWPGSVIAAIPGNRDSSLRATTDGVWPSSTVTPIEVTSSGPRREPLDRVEGKQDAEVLEAVAGVVEAGDRERLPPTRAVSPTSRPERSPAIAVPRAAVDDDEAREANSFGSRPKTRSAPSTSSFTFATSATPGSFATCAASDSGQERAREVGDARLEEPEVGAADVGEVAGGAVDAVRDREQRHDQRRPRGPTPTAVNAVREGRRSRFLQIRPAQLTGRRYIGASPHRAVRASPTAGVRSGRVPGPVPGTRPEGTCQAGRVQRSGFGVREVRIRGFRSARAVGFSPGPLCALVGGPSVGKSNVLAAVWTLLRQDAPPPAPGDVAATARRPSGSPRPWPAATRSCSRRARTAARRAPGPRCPSSSCRPPSAPAASSPSRARHPVRRPRQSASDRPRRAAALVERRGGALRARRGGLVLLIEEPELFLRPQAQRYLYRLLRGFAEAGNQVLYSTHSPAFLDVGRLDELALVDWGPRHGTTIVQPEPLPADAGFRAAQRARRRAQRAAARRGGAARRGPHREADLPVRLPRARPRRRPARDLDRRVRRQAEHPALRPHLPGDRDPVRRRPRPRRRAPARSRPRASASSTRRSPSSPGPSARSCSTPDFEAVAGLRGHSHKPARALELFSTIAPEQASGRAPACRRARRRARVALGESRAPPERDHARAGDAGDAGGSEQRPHAADRDDETCDGDRDQPGRDERAPREQRETRDEQHEDGGRRPREDARRRPAPSRPPSRSRAPERPRRR